MNTCRLCDLNHRSQELDIWGNKLRHWSVDEYAIVSELHKLDPTLRMDVTSEYIFTQASIPTMSQELKCIFSHKVKQCTHFNPI